MGGRALSRAACHGVDSGGDIHSVRQMVESTSGMPAMRSHTAYTVTPRPSGRPRHRPRARHRDP